MFIYDRAIPAHKYCPRSGNWVYIDYNEGHHISILFLPLKYFTQILQFLFHIMLNRCPFTFDL